MDYAGGGAGDLDDKLSEFVDSNVNAAASIEYDSVPVGGSFDKHPAQVVGRDNIHRLCSVAPDLDRVVSPGCNAERRQKLSRMSWAILLSLSEDVERSHNGYGYAEVVPPGLSEPISACLGDGVDAWEDVGQSDADKAGLVVSAPLQNANRALDIDVDCLVRNVEQLGSAEDISQ